VAQKQQMVAKRRHLPNFRGRCNTKDRERYRALSPEEKHNLAFKSYKYR
jgi:hypothetical protein